MWDLATGSCAFSHQLQDTIADTLKWDLTSDSVLVTATDDGFIRVSDIRDSNEVASYKFDAKVENFSADPFSPNEFALSFDNGYISGLDLRSGFKPLFNHQISNKAVTSVSYNPHIKGMICTTSLDGTMSLFNANTRESENKPKLVCREFANQVEGDYRREIYSEDRSTRTCRSCSVVEAARENSLYGLWRATRT